MLIDSTIPYLNESVNKVLDMLCPGVFTISFDTLKLNKSGEYSDKFNINIIHNIKGTNCHKKLSGGEKRLIDIACMYALRMLAEKLYEKRFHHVLYDEVLDSLDDEISSLFCNSIRLINPNDCVVLVSHNKIDDIEYDRIFNF
jgi:ABC-type multidrug transport system ATPase subunit